MPGLPKLPKFKGDNSQSLRIWIQEFEAQLAALGHEKERWRDLLLCTTEGKAFTFITTKIGELDGKISYAECKSKMLEHFCGSDYQRTLEMKLRSFHFRPGMNISNFVTDLRNTINELYNIKDEKAVDLIAISHVTTSLDEELREPIRILQLSGTATLEGILELIQSKQTQHSFSPEIPVASSTNADSNNRLDRLEKLVEGLTNTVTKINYQQ